MKRMNWFSWRSVAAAGAAVVACLAVIAATPNSPPKLKISDREINRDTPGVSYASVIKRVTPSVVTIQSTRTVRQNFGYGNPFFDDPMFRQFFGIPRGARPSPMIEQSLGSGVIVSDDGYILTNNHVVEGSDPDGVKVALSDGKTKYDAKVVGRDPHTDIAVLKIDAKKLTPITIADSDRIEVGDVVLAIGNPFNVGQSVTMGIVSAVGRGVGILGQGGYEDFIQTDAAINPGNSGGALVDAEGRLVGINQSIASPSGGNSGVGFAVPINLARSVMDRLATDGKITRGYLGVNPQEVTPDLAKAFNLPDTSGALVGGVLPNTPAEKAGIREGDVITEFNGKKVTDPRHLRLMVAQTRPTTKATVQVLRDGREKTMTVTLGILPEDFSDARGEYDDSSRVESQNEQLDGVEVADLDNRTRRQMDIPDRIRGALVTRVEPGSKAAEAGLREGDVIVEINRQPVRDANTAVELSEKATGNSVLLRVYSQENGAGATRYLTVEAGKSK